MFRLGLLSIFISSVLGCSTAASPKTDLASGLFKAFSASKEELRQVAAEGAPETEECEKEQRANLFWMSLPPVQAYVYTNKLLIGAIEKLGYKDSNNGKALGPSGCVLNPYHGN